MSLLCAHTNKPCIWLYVYSNNSNIVLVPLCCTLEVSFAHSFIIISERIINYEWAREVYNLSWKRSKLFSKVKRYFFVVQYLFAIIGVFLLLYSNASMWPKYCEWILYELFAENYITQNYNSIHIYIYTKDG